MVDAKAIIEAALRQSGMTQAQLAEAVGTSRAAFSSRLKYGKFTVAEWQRMAEAMGGRLVLDIEFPHLTGGQNAQKTGKRENTCTGHL